MRTAGDDIGAHVVDLTAHQSIHGRSTAVKGHERRIRAYDRIEEQTGGKEDRADAGMRLVERACVRLQIGTTTCCTFGASSVSFKPPPSG
jgi:hypothetical protein